MTPKVEESFVVKHEEAMDQFEHYIEHFADNSEKYLNGVIVKNYVMKIWYDGEK